MTYETFINAVVVYKCFITRLWHDSPHLFKQFNRIGPALSQALLNAEIDSFDKILSTQPRQLEKILNKHPPFGNQIIETIQKLPHFKIEFDLIEKNENKSTNKKNKLNPTTIMLDIRCVMTNSAFLNTCEKGGCLGYSNPIMFILGDEKNNLIFAQRLRYFPILSLRYHPILIQTFLKVIRHFFKTTEFGPRSFIQISERMDVLFMPLWFFYNSVCLIYTNFKFLFPITF